MKKEQPKGFCLTGLGKILGTLPRAGIERLRTAIEELDLGF